MKKLIGLKYILTNKLFQVSILTISFFLVCFVVYKAINLRKDVDKYKNQELLIENKLENKVKIEYQENQEYQDDDKYKGAISIVKCLKTPLKDTELTNELKNISQSIEDLFNESNYNFAFKYKDMFTGFSLSYNSNQPIFTASTIKAPEAIYIYEEAEKGNVNLEDTITYTSNYYSEGTGVLKNKPFNEDYTIRDLVYYSITYSDNAAHLMLNNKFKSNNMYSYWNNLGTTTIFKDGSAWGSLTANDGVIYMEELYKYYINDNKYSTELLNYFENAWKLISTPGNNIKIANKSGWSNYALHDAALILEDNPYVLVILTNRGYTDYIDFFNKASTLIYNFHKEYWNIKTNNCKY